MSAQNEANCHSPVMPFWQQLQRHGDSPALIDCDTARVWTYRMLALAVDACAEQLRSDTKGLVLLYVESDIDALVCYLASLAAGCAVLLSGSRIDRPGAAAFIELYRPQLVLWRRGTPPAGILDQYLVRPPVLGYQALARRASDTAPLHPQLALILPTSGSTGCVKLARLSGRSICVAAAQVVTALGIESHGRTMAAPSFAHVYGLSVINSHLLAGASLVLTRHSAADRKFWMAMDRARVNSIAGVSMMYAYMRTLGIDAASLPSLRTLTHSGQRIAADLLAWLISEFVSRDRQLYLMYGQTEACGRISVLPPERLLAAANSVGHPVPWGSIAVTDEQEILYSGPNVMMGYASCREELNRGDELNGRLHTGDLGCIDPNGMLHITGRKNRICKVFGLRINLDEVEQHLADHLASDSEVAVLGEDDRLTICFVDGDERVRSQVRRFSSEHRLPPQCVRTIKVAALPRTAGGKIAYSELRASLA